jgi:hypothetical protein
VVRAQDEAVSHDSLAVTRTEVEGLLEGMNEQLQTLQTETDKLKRFKFSGYLQARTEFSGASSDEVGVTGSPATLTVPNQTRFYVRRARVKLTYDSNPLFVVTFDGGQDRTIRLLDGYVTLFDPWTPMRDHQLTIGQFNVPFGWEIERSSSVRELPERSRAENVLFSGERDRGIKLESQWTPQLKTTLALLNGGGINSADFPTTDPTKAKDLLARVRWSQGGWDAAVSWYDGQQVTPLTVTDVLTDKTRLGLDAQVYWELPTLGGGSVRGEYYAGSEVNPDSLDAKVDKTTRAPKLGVSMNNLATDMLGWYAMVVQNVGERFQAVVRYDTYDRNTNTAFDEYRRWSLGMNAFYDGFTRFTVSYDAIRTGSKVGGRYVDVDPKDDLWTFQIQHRF